MAWVHHLTIRKIIFVLYTLRHYIGEARAWLAVAERHLREAEEILHDQLDSSGHVIYDVEDEELEW